MKKLSVIIPSYNESATITIILERVIKARLPSGIAKEIIVIDDSSTDDTIGLVKAAEIDFDFKIKLISQPVNRGKGAAIRRGFMAASGDYCIVQDADLEYDPDDYQELIKPVLKADADVVYGSRFMGDKPHRVLFFWHSIGNFVLTFLSNIFTNLNLTDMETCYKLIRTSILKNILLEENRFGFEPEITSKLARIPGIKIFEVGISYYGRTYKEGKKISWKDGFRAVWCIVKYNVFRRKNIHRFPLLFIVFIMLWLGIAILISPPAIFPDQGAGFQVMRSMEMGGGFNLLISPDQDDISKNASQFLAWWSPGQYLIPYLFKLFLKINTGKAIAITVTICNLAGVAGFYQLFKKLGFSKKMAAFSILFVVTQQFFIIPYVFYNGGETLLFAFSGWFLYGCFSFKQIDLKTFIFILFSGWIGFLCKSSFLWVYACGLFCLWVVISGNKKPVKWLLTGVYILIPAAISLAAVYLFFLSKGDSPVTGSLGLHINIESFAFPLAAPLLAGFSIDDLVHGLLYHPDGAMFGAGITVFILLMLAVISIILFITILRCVPFPNYRVSLCAFYGISVLCFTIFFLKQADISYEGRHFRMVGLMIIPGTLFLLNTFSKSFKLIFLLVWSGIAFSTIHFLYTGYKRNKIFAHGSSGIAQQFIDQPSLNYIQALDNYHNNAVFVFINADIGLEIIHNRVITIDQNDPDIKINPDIYNGRQVPLYILLPVDFAKNDRAKIIENCFPDYKSFHERKLDNRYVLYEGN